MLWLSALVATKVIIKTAITNGMIIHGASTRGLRLVRAVLAGDPETRNTVILGCYTRNSNFRDSSGEIIMFMFGVEPIVAHVQVMCGNVLHRQVSLGSTAQGEAVRP